MGCWGVGERQSLEEIMLNDRENIYLGFRFQVARNDRTDVLAITGFGKVLANIYAKHLQY